MLGLMGGGEGRGGEGIFPHSFSHRKNANICFSFTAGHNGDSMNSQGKSSTLRDHFNHSHTVSRLSTLLPSALEGRLMVVD